jgi:hypothetical protein
VRAKGAVGAVHGGTSGFRSLAGFLPAHNGLTR